MLGCSWIACRMLIAVFPISPVLSPVLSAVLFTVLSRCMALVKSPASSSLVNSILADLASARLMPEPSLR